MNKRHEHDFPYATGKPDWKYHHLGIPTDKIMPEERYLKKLRIHVSGFDTSPYGIEWMRFDPDCTIPELITTVPHLAFVVDDIEKELEGKEILSGLSSPCDGIRVAMITDNGAPVELMEYTGEESSNSHG